VAREVLAGWWATPFSTPREDWLAGRAGTDPRKARELLRSIEAQVAAGAAITLKNGGVVTLAAYISTFHERRDGRVGAADGELQNLRNHVEPILGAMPLADIRPRHVRDLVLGLRKSAELAPGTIRHVYGVLRRLMREAMMDELIATNPCDMPSGILPERVDKDPEWREQAVYTRAEPEQLIGDERIPLGRRVLYALKGLGALRHGEAAGLRWRHHDVTTKPLGALTVANSYLRKGTKTGVTRRMPVHPGWRRCSRSGSSPAGRPSEARSRRPKTSSCRTRAAR
jgi:integrase